MPGTERPSGSGAAALVRQLPWAAAAVGKELLGFRFDFPIDIVDNAERPGSIRYYIYSERLFRDHLGQDEQGVAVHAYRAQGRQYNPVFIACSGLMSLERYSRSSNPDDLKAFHAQVRWLKHNAVSRPDGTTVWPYRFDWQEGRCLLKAPWISAMSQGLGISALVRAFRLTREEALLSLCERSVRVFERSVEEGGVRTHEGGHALYEEYPGYPLARVLDGFLFSLLGLYDLAQELGSGRVRQLFEAGIEGLKYRLPEWDYRGKWSWYGTHGYLCPPHYHRLNCALVRVLGRLTGDPLLQQRGESWHRVPLSRLDKAEIFALFALTKNLARLRLPRN
jgi:heparosan-N-sulfate-glucuronate 5-epimerase